jgi:L-ascorbate metabolism protein UlaG (beta-lactamase superfamily)
MTTRTLVAIAFAAICVRASAGELTFTLLGNEAFHITDGKTTLLSDFPYRSGAWGYHEYDLNAVPPIHSGLTLITHAHDDHWSRPEFEKMRIKIIGPPAVTERLDQARVIPLSEDRPMHHEDITVEAVSTPHNLAAEHYSFLVTWHAVRFYFPGDTESPAEVLAQRDIDVMFITPWLIQSIRELNKTVDAKVLVGYHLFPDEVADPLQGCRTMKQGESFTVHYPDESND